jgi:metallo-beta-lactamase class B
MKNILVIFFLIAGMLNAFGQQDKYPLKITHLSGDFYVYVSYGTFAGKHYPANAMYLVTKEGVILFDTPWDEQYYQPLLDSIWTRHHRKVMMCISTHFHQDRTGGLKYYAAKGIKTYATHRTDSLCIIHHDNRARFLIPEDTVFHIGGYTFQTYYAGPGHTRDNIVIWFPRQNILYGGCFIKSTQDKDLGNIEDADVKEWGYSLRRLQKKFPDPRYIIVGHNNWENKNSIRHTIDMVSDYNKIHK